MWTEDDKPRTFVPQYERKFKLDKTKTTEDITGLSSSFTASSNSFTNRSALTYTMRGPGVGENKSKSRRPRGAPRNWGMADLPLQHQ